jgi:soluble lytic murein transglycosylase-like protein
MAGLLVTGTAVATAVALPAWASTHGDDPVASADTTSSTSTSTTSTTTAPPTTEAPAPDPAAQAANLLASATPGELAAFQLYVATPEQIAAFKAYVSPPPPPPPPPAPKPAPATAPRPAATPPRSSTGGGAPANSFLACVRNRESRGNYQAYNPSGAAGAYQLMPQTARNTALHAGRSDLANTPVTSWSPADQDAMAAHLYQWQGAAPWAGPGC